MIGLSGVLISFQGLWTRALMAATGSDLRLVAPATITRTPGAILAPLDRALAAADAVVPDSRAAQLVLPRRATDPIVVRRRLSWWRQPDILVSVHPETAEVVKVLDPRRYEAGPMIHRLNRGLHSGEVGPEFMRWIWLFATLVPVLSIYTGLRIAWKPRRERSRY